MGNPYPPTITYPTKRGEGKSSKVPWEKGCDRSQEDIVQTTTRQSNNLHSLILITTAGRNLDLSLVHILKNIGKSLYTVILDLFFHLRLLEMSFWCQKHLFWRPLGVSRLGGPGISSGFRLWSRKAASMYSASLVFPGVWSKWICYKTLKKILGSFIYNKYPP